MHSRRHPVVVMRPAEHGNGDDLVCVAAGLPCYRNRNALGQPLMMNWGKSARCVGRRRTRVFGVCPAR